jgi:hypothetical protein
MAQAAKIIDVTRSYVPVDPETFPQTMHGTTGEDNPEERTPVIPYQGYNFLPTTYGYKSFFGLTSNLDVDALTSRVDEIFIIQTETLRNILVALCEDGIWTKRGDTTGVWTHNITLAIPAVGAHKNWTYCVIANQLLCYRQGEASVWKLNTANLWVPTAFVPNTLNMSGQIGIFKAGARLGFWDSDGSVAWSNFDDFGDYVPAIATMAGFAKFNGIVGKIVTIKPEDDGFIIYCTKSIVRVVRNFASAYLWETKTLVENTGISYSFEVAMGTNDSIHFALTSTGLFKIEKGQMENLIPGVVDYLKKARQPIGLQIFQGRFLFFEVLDLNLITGQVNFQRQILPATTFSLQDAYELYINFDPAADFTMQDNQNLLSALQQWHGPIQVKQANAPCALEFNGYCEEKDHPIFESVFATVFSLDNLMAFAQNPTRDYFFETSGYPYAGDITIAISNVTLSNASASLLSQVPQNQLLISLGPVGNNSGIEPFASNFFSRQEELWHLDSKFFDTWRSAIELAFADTFVCDQYDLGLVDTSAPTFSQESTFTIVALIDPGFFSEANRVYGEYGINASWKGLFAHKSLTRIVTAQVTTKTFTTILEE